MPTTKNQAIKIIIGLSCIAMITASCKKFVEVGIPETNATAESVYTNNPQAAAVVTGLLAKVAGNAASGWGTGRGSITVYTGLTGEELEAFTASGTSLMSHYLNLPTMDAPLLWNDLYSQLYIANAAIEGISASTGVSENMKKQLVGEAKFMRALLHFYLVNLYGDVPLITTTDYRVNQVAPRTTAAGVYQQITADLHEARDLLADDYKLPDGKVTTQRLRPNRSAATSMLARVYLYLGDWNNAQTYSTELIDNPNYELAMPITNIFSATSKEAIWQAQVTNTQYNTYDGYTFIRTVAPNSLEPVALTRTVVDAFEENDQRKTNWIDSITIATVKYYYPKKYKVKGGNAATTVISEHLTPLRLAEQYLIRAEARAKLGLLTGPNSAQSDIDAIRSRAGLGNTTAATEPELLAAIEQERRIELFCEFGHRWFDLKRTNRIDEVMTAIAPLKSAAPWNPAMKLFPLPRTEMDRNPFLQPQNPGYN